MPIVFVMIDTCDGRASIVKQSTSRPRAQFGLIPAAFAIMPLASPYSVLGATSTVYIGMLTGRLKAAYTGFVIEAGFSRPVSYVMRPRAAIGNRSA